MQSRLFLADISIAGHMNGVTRCLQVLAKSFSKDKDFHVTWIHFETGGQSIMRTVMNRLTRITIPLPHPIADFLTNTSRQQELWEEVYPLMEIESNNTANVIIHIHTLNLIKFALWVKQRHPCKIVTHLHCIPWKSLYNRENRRFHRLYRKYYASTEGVRTSDFIFHEYEYVCYMSSDSIICVTQCAKDFLKRMFPDKSLPIKVVYNGIQDILAGEPHLSRNTHTPIKCLFVGNSYPGKGLDYILESLELLFMRHEITLYVVGAFNNQQRDEIFYKHPFLDIRFTGLLPLVHLRNYYRTCDIGLISSIHEQCSYVAIEMMMFGLPIVSTAVDGLNELFPNSQYAKRIPLHFVSSDRLQPDIVRMADAISQLIMKPEKRAKMSANVRRRYEARFQEDKMIHSIKNIYRQLLTTES